MDSFIETFHIDWKTIIAQLINFGIVLAVLYFLMIKPLRKVMNERTYTIEKGLTDAKINKELVENTKKEYDSAIAKARAEAHDIFQEAKRDAESKRVEMLEIAKLDVEKMVDNGKKTLESEKVKMVEEAKREIVSLVVKATEKILSESSNDDVNKKQINRIKKA